MFKKMEGKSGSSEPECCRVPNPPPPHVFSRRLHPPRYKWSLIWAKISFQMKSKWLWKQLNAAHTSPGNESINNILFITRTYPCKLTLSTLHPDARTFARTSMSNRCNGLPFIIMMGRLSKWPQTPYSIMRGHCMCAVCWSVVCGVCWHDRRYRAERGSALAGP